MWRSDGHIHLGRQMMILSSSQFQENGEIPRKYTCQGEMISPPLAWSDVPARAKSLALIVEDDDAVEVKVVRDKDGKEVRDKDGNEVPLVGKDGKLIYLPHRNHPWVHWVLYNIPPNATLPEGASRAEGARRELQGALEGVNGGGGNRLRRPLPTRSHRPTPLPPPSLRARPRIHRSRWAQRQ